MQKAIIRFLKFSFTMLQMQNKLIECLNSLFDCLKVKTLLLLYISTKNQNTGLVLLVSACFQVFYSMFEY